MPEFRVIVALDMNADDKEAAKRFGLEIAKAQVGKPQRTSNASAREGAYKGSRARVYGADIVEVRDR